MNRILFACFVFIYSFNLGAQEKTCLSILEEKTRLNEQELEVEILKNITQQKKDLATKFMKVAQDIFVKVDEYRSRTVSGSDAQAILDMAVYRYKTTFDGVYCSSGKFHGAPTGRDLLLENQERTFTDNAMRIVRLGGCANYTYYQMFAYRDGYTKLKIGRVYPFDLNESIDFHFHPLTHRLEGLFDPYERETFVISVVQSIFESSMNVVGERILTNVRNELANHFCPESKSKPLGRYIWIPLTGATRKIAEKFVSDSPKSWSKPQ